MNEEIQAWKHVTYQVWRETGSEELDYCQKTQLQFEQNWNCDIGLATSKLVSSRIYGCKKSWCQVVCHSVTNNTYLQVFHQLKLEQKWNLDIELVISELVSCKTCIL